MIAILFSKAFLDFVSKTKMVCYFFIYKIQAQNWVKRNLIHGKYLYLYLWKYGSSKRFLMNEELNHSDQKKKNFWENIQLCGTLGHFLRILDKTTNSTIPSMGAKVTLWLSNNSSLFKTQTQKLHQAIILHHVEKYLRQHCNQIAVSQTKPELYCRINGAPGSKYPSFVKDKPVLLGMREQLLRQLDQYSQLEIPFNETSLV